MKAPKYWPHWAVTIVREEARRFHSEMAGEFPDPEELREKYVRVVNERIEKALPHYVIGHHEALKTFVTRFEDSKLDADIEKLLTHFHGTATKSIRENPTGSMVSWWWCR